MLWNSSQTPTISRLRIAYIYFMKIILHTDNRNSKNRYNFVDKEDKSLAPIPFDNDVDDFLSTGVCFPLKSNGDKVQRV